MSVFDVTSQTVQAALQTGQAGHPVAARVTACLDADHGRIERRIARILHSASGWFDCNPERLTVFGDVAAGHVSALALFTGGQSALVSAGCHPTADPLLELVVWGNRGILSWEHDRGFQPNDVRQEPDLSAAERGLVDHVQAALGAGTPVEIGGRSPGGSRVRRRPRSDARTHRADSASSGAGPKAQPPPYGVLLVAGDHTHQPQYADGLVADPRCRLVGLTDEHDVTPRRRQLNRQLAERLGIPVLPDLSEALHRDDVHIVSICAEPIRRGRIIVQAAAAGKHLYLDKPLAATLSDADGIRQAVSQDTPMKLETQCLHAGTVPDPSTNSRAIPVHRTSSYVFNDTEHAARLFALQELGNIYTRLMNPTHDALEQRIAALEGRAAALAHASGTAAVFNSINTICRSGDEIVAANNLYGGTFTMFNDLFPQFGLTVRFVDPNEPENFAAAITTKTQAVFCETLSNPACDVSDIEAIADIAHAHGIPLIVDATFTTPVLQRSIEFGADIVVNSLTKWLGGHGTGIGGVVVDSGRFGWKSDRFPLLNEPDSSYGGLRWAHDLPAELAPLAYILRMRTVPMRNLGACISPDNAWMFLQGIETLPLRMERHCENAQKVAAHLNDHAAVEWVRYPGLPDDPAHSKNDKYLNGMGGTMVVFGIRGGAAQGRTFIESLELFSHLANVGDAKSLAIHPATTTHSQLSEEQQIAGGIRPELIRLSVGIEHIDDIIEDIDRALAAAR